MWLSWSLLFWSSTASCNPWDIGSKNMLMLLPLRHWVGNCLIQSVKGLKVCSFSQHWIMSSLTHQWKWIFDLITNPPWCLACYWSVAIFLLLMLSHYSYWCWCLSLHQSFLFILWYQHHDLSSSHHSFLGCVCSCFLIDINIDT